MPDNTADKKVVSTPAAPVEEKKAAAKKPAEKKATAAKKPAEKKATAAKKPAEKKAVAKKPAEKKATAAKKPAEKKATAAKKPAAKKTAAAIDSKVVIQANGVDVTTADLIEKAKKASKEKNISKIALYIVPGSNKVYPVINGIPEAEFDLF
ncbi:MAG: hypothetical protein J6X85_02540 [Ruminococcus sp.]|nr:hypothetical protein [Ruminococcus sp.]